MIRKLVENWGPRQLVKVIAPVGTAIGASAEQTTAVVAFVVAGLGFVADLAWSWAAKKVAERKAR